MTVSTPTSFSRSRHGDAGRRLLHPMERKHQKFEVSLERAKTCQLFMRGCQGDVDSLDSIENNGLWHALAIFGVEKSPTHR